MQKHPMMVGPGPRPPREGPPPPANTEHIKRKFLDLAYAHLSPAQKLDIYLPDEGEGPFPVILSIHGGGFMGGDKGDMPIMPMLEGLKRGYAVVGVNYRLSGEARFPALVYDGKAAVRWIRAHAQRYHLNPERIAVWGGSAGAWLANMLGVSAGVRELEDLTLGNPEQSSNVQAVVSWFSPTNFLEMDEQLTASGLPPTPEMKHSAANSPESLLMGEQITKIPAKVKAANPETYVTASAPPFFLQHGTLDCVVPVQGSIRLAAKLEKALGKGKVRLELLEGAGHGDPRFDAPENVEKVLDFIDQHLKAHEII
jgi:acetyl esterase/lipase